MLRPSKRGVIQ